MRYELIEYHSRELEIKRDALRSWENAENPDKMAHIETLRVLVNFHERALDWLRAT